MIPGLMAFLSNLIIATFFLRKNNYHSSNVLLTNFSILGFLSITIEIIICILHFLDHTNITDYFSTGLIEMHFILLLVIDIN